VHRASDGLDGQHTVDQGQGSELHSLYGGQESPSGGCGRYDQEGTEGASDRGQVDMVIGKDNGKWLPPHVCDSCQPEDNLTLMNSEFHPRYIRRETWRFEERA
jgi:hypothetical protein